MAPINRGLLISAVLTIIGTFFVAQFYVHDLKVFWAVLTGVVLGQVVSRITEYYTSTETSPVREIAESARTGPGDDGTLRHQHRPRVLGPGPHRHRPGHRGGHRPRER